MRQQKSTENVYAANRRQFSSEDKGMKVKIQLDLRPNRPATP